MNYFRFFDNFWPRAKLKGPKRNFVVVVVIGGESFWNEQEMFAMEQKMFSEQNYCIELPSMALYSRVWPCMISFNFRCCLVALCGFIIRSFVAFISPFLAIIDPNSSHLVFSIIFFFSGRGWNCYFRSFLPFYFLTKIRKSKI